jgi:cytochrome c
VPDFHDLAGLEVVGVRTGRVRLIGLAACLLVAAGCGAQAKQPTKIEVPGGDADRGRQAIAQYGCGSCHTVPGITRADATVGPPLTAWAERASIAGEFPNRPEYLVAWIHDPQALLPGSIMPNTGVSMEAAQDIAAYLYTLHGNTAQLAWR